MEETLTQTNQTGKGIEKVAYGILGIMAFLLPFFFVPSQAVSVSIAKGLLITAAVVLALAALIISLIKEARISFPRNLFTLSVVLIPAVFVASAIARGGGLMSFLGYNLELGTVVSIILGALIILLVAQLFRPKDRIFYSYLGFFAAFAIVSVFEIVKVFFGSSAFDFGIFTAKVSNPVGNWNDLAVFFGAAVILSLATLEMVELPRRFRVLVGIAFILSLIFLFLVNFTTAWIVVGVFALIFFLYFFSFDKFSVSRRFARDAASQYEESTQVVNSKKVSWKALIVIALALASMFFSQTLADKTSSTFGIVDPEVRPSWSPTLDIVKGEFMSQPYFGSGPNAFNNAWLMYKPAAINQTAFWNTDFSYGISLIPTFAVTTGLLGTLSWILFFAVFISIGIRALFSQTNDLFSRYLISSSFITSLYFWVMSVVYDPSIVNFVLGCFFTGLFAASLYREGLLQSKELSLSHHPKLSFLSVLVLIVILIGNISLGYFVVQKSLSVVCFQKALLAFSQDNNIDNASNTTLQAINLANYDIFYRGISELNLGRMNSLLNSTSTNQAAIRDQFQQALAASIQSAQQATVVNPKDYQNWLTLAQIYAALVPPPFSVAGAYDNAKSALNEALKVNPHSPDILLQLARLEYAKGDSKSATDYVNQAIAEKSNYADAHFLLAQIEAGEGNITNAISSLQTTILLSPDDPGLYFQLGVLQYTNKDFAGATDSFGKAVELVPNYANAQYFLGLSSYYIGDKANALKQFEDLQKTNPDNAEINLILTNLQNNKDPFANAKPPVTPRPETRSELPLQQSN